ncbi:MAG: hypothetical protein K0R57_4307 [Paenibacillaceae bacterium]|jgi:hypothetical protein|nr:hypothetical protein [Paenibacillaceae bacterium]
MKAPVIYADWVRCFDAFAAGDEDEQTLLLMEQGTIDWTTGIDSKMTERLYQLLEKRLKQASEQMHLEFSRNQQTDDHVVRALLNARRRFAVLLRLVSLKAYPPEIRAALKHTLNSYVIDSQSALEKSAAADRTGHLSMLIRNNPLTNYEVMAKEQSSAAAIPNPLHKAVTGPNTRKRRVLWKHE